MLLPENFVQRMQSQLPGESDAFFASLDDAPPVSIRLHHRKGNSPFENLERVPWCDTGYYLPERPSFHLDPHWHAGAYYVQEASSMILDEVLRQHVSTTLSPHIWLDLCAAPGGKTGILAKHMQATDVLIANEVVSQRRSVLRENLVKGGFMHTVLTGIHPETFPSSLADVILLDAPCAGEGMMRKDPEAVRQWTPQLVTSCALLQQDIMHHAIRALKPGGVLIYSTCSYSMTENIRNVQHAMSKTAVENLTCIFPEAWQIATIEENGATGYQLYPHRVKGEGLFIAVLRKGEAEKQTTFQKTKTLGRPLDSHVKPFLRDDTDWKQIDRPDGICVVAPGAQMAISQVLPLLPKAELFPVMQIKGRDIIPAHFLAMSPALAADIPCLALDKEQALDFLERKIPHLEQALPIGWYVVTFGGSSLGWLKRIAAGWKSHYPMEWRLRKRN